MEIIETHRIPPPVHGVLAVAENENEEYVISIKGTSLAIESPYANLNKTIVLIDPDRAAAVYRWHKKIYSKKVFHTIISEALRFLKTKDQLLIPGRAEGRHALNDWVLGGWYTMFPSIQNKVGFELDSSDEVLQGVFVGTVLGSSVLHQVTRANPTKNRRLEGDSASARKVQKNPAYKRSRKLLASALVNAGLRPEDVDAVARLLDKYDIEYEDVVKSFRKEKSTSPVKNIIDAITKHLNKQGFWSRAEDALPEDTKEILEEMDANKQGIPWGYFTGDIEVGVEVGLAFEGSPSVLAQDEYLASIVESAKSRRN